MGEIDIKCTGTEYAAIESLSDFQGEIKNRSRKSMEKLKRSILDEGFCAPVFVWHDSGTGWIIDGHQRVKALGELKAEGWEVPEIPVVSIIAKDRQDAITRLLVISSQYGEFDAAEVAAFAQAYDLILEELPIQFAGDAINLDAAMVDVDSFFEKGEVKEKAPKMCLCPECGRGFEI